MEINPAEPRGAPSEIEVASAADVADFFIYTMHNCARDLASYSDEQVARGLKVLTSPSCSDLVFRLMQKPLSKERRRDVVLSTQFLYRGCFGPRCSPALLHRGEAGGNALNDICFMFWDTSPLLSGAPEAVLKVLHAGLMESNPACQESALHGLGHFVQITSDATRANEVISGYLRSAGRTELRAYARRALEGRLA